MSSISHKIKYFSLYFSLKDLIISRVYFCLDLNLGGNLFLVNSSILNSFVTDGYVRGILLFYYKDTNFYGT